MTSTTRFARSGRPYASVFPGGGSLRVSTDEAATSEMWKEHSPADASGLERLRRVSDGLAASYLPLYASPQPSWAVLTALRAVRRSRRNVGLGELAGTLVSSTRGMGDRYVATPEAKSLAAAWGGRRRDERCRPGPRPGRGPAATTSTSS